MNNKPLVGVMVGAVATFFFTVAYSTVHEMVLSLFLATLSVIVLSVYTALVRST